MDSKNRNLISGEDFKMSYAMGTSRYGRERRRPSVFYAESMKTMNSNIDRTKPYIPEANELEVIRVLYTNVGVLGYIWLQFVCMY